jgi:hypothetical protein
MQLLTLISAVAALAAGGVYFGSVAWNLYRADHADHAAPFGKERRRG